MNATHASATKPWENTPPGDGSVVAIVINYNGGAALLKCLDSLGRQTYPPKEIVVVDNLSTDDSLVRARQAFPSSTFIANTFNAGWGVGCNIGIQASRSEFIAILNNDAHLDLRCIEEMVAAIRRRQDYGACASRILLWDEPNTMEVAGIVIYRDGSSIGRGRLAPATAYAESDEVFCANDCCCLYRRAMIDDIGLYDPDFFIYCDETDMGWRQQLAGWRCIYNPAAIAYHAHSRAAGSYTDFKLFHVERNRIFICLKYFPLLRLAASFPVAFHRYFYCAWAAARGRGALRRYRDAHSMWHGIAVLARAHWAALRKASVMWRRRREFNRRWRIPRRAFKDILRRFGVGPRTMVEYE